MEHSPTLQEVIHALSGLVEDMHFDIQPDGTYRADIALADGRRLTLYYEGRAVEDRPRPHADRPTGDVLDFDAFDPATDSALDFLRDA